MDDAEFRRRRRRELVDDRVSGASQLARQALDSLAEFAGSCAATETGELRTACLDFAEELQYARPNMAPIYNLIQRWVDRVESLAADDAGGLRHAAAAAAQELSDASVRAVAEAAGHSADLVGDDAVVITHSMSSTVQACFRTLARRGVRAIVSESRPGLEGRDQALQLDYFGIPVSFVTDAELGHFSGRASVALVGADMLLTDGSLVNKAGTYLLALAARDRGIPFYVCCESFKQVPYSSSGLDLETADPRELDAPRGRHITPHNVYFDITPARLVDAWITEDGVTQAGDGPPA